MDCCCCTKPCTRPVPSGASFRRYRRSTLTKAPRKRTFIANMNKFLIDYAMPSGLAGESFFGASTLCQVPSCQGPICGGQAVAPVPTYETMNGNGGGNGRGRPGAMLGGGDDQGNNDAQLSDQMSALPFIVAVALSAVLYPALEFLAPPMAVACPVPAVAATLEVQPKAAAEEVEELITFDTIQSAIDAFLMGDDADCGEMTAEPKLSPN